MGAKSYIVRGKGNPESFESSSHGADRALSRGEAKRKFSLADHAAATVAIECAAASSHGTGALARGYGAEVGARVDPRPGLHGSIDAWYLYLPSEQVWSGDAGGTEASDPTRRFGLDVDASWDVTPWLSVDANVALARSTLIANQGNGGALALTAPVVEDVHFAPGMPLTVLLGATVTY